MSSSTSSPLLRCVGSMIEDVAFHPRRVITDSRGDIMHYLRADTPLLKSFGEAYLSAVQPNAIKAWKRHHRVAQNLCVPVGEVRVVVYDNRPGSASEGSINEYHLSRKCHGVLHLPAMLWYGFAGLAEHESLIVNCVDEIHDPEESDRLPWDDSSIPHQWQTK